MIGRILIIFLAAGSCIHSSPAFSSVTKVGNGDDGADLEALRPLTSGPIFDARGVAVKRLRALNVAGIAGLSALIPEVERSELLLASADVHPTGEPTGSLEISDDGGLVYARTFAEPYAATRFFPAAERLNEEQLIALHIHEALHRALAPDIRENEDIIMHLTLALTSPGASHDRVRQVARLYVRQTAVASMDYKPLTVTKAPFEEPRTLPKAAPSSIEGAFSIYPGSEGSGKPETRGYRFGFGSSLGGYQRLGARPVEPYVRARLMLFDEFGRPNRLGQSAFDLAGRMESESGAVLAPFVRFTAKSLDEEKRSKFDRDIWTFGVTHQRQWERSYFEAQVFYSLASSVRNYVEYEEGTSFSGDIEYKPVLSIMTSTGFRYRALRFGVMADLHASDGGVSNESSYRVRDGVGYADRETRVDPFRLIVVGPEIGYYARLFQARIHFKSVSNGPYRNLSDLGDVMDRGAGGSDLGISLATRF